MKKIIDIMDGVPVYGEIDEKEYQKKKANKEKFEIKQKEESIKIDIENTEKLLKNSNFLNNQNYVNSRLISSSVYSGYLDLFNLNKFYQIAVISNDIIKIVITLIVGYMFLIVPFILVFKIFIKTNISFGILFVLIFLFSYVIFYLITGVLVKHINNIKWIIKYKDKLSLFDLFFYTENKWFIDKGTIQLKKRSKEIMKYYSEVQIIIFLLIIFVIVNYGLNNQYSIVFIYFVSFIFININNVIYYMLYKIFSKIKYIYNLIYYYFYPEKKKIYLLNPLNKKVNVIFKIENGGILTDSAFIKDK